MQSALLLTFLALGPGQAMGQEEIIVQVAAEDVRQMEPTCSAGCEQPRCERLWGDVEYLFWWVREGPLPTPLVTTGPPRNPFPGGVGPAFPGGAVNQPGTIVLFGGQSLYYDRFDGLRLTLGGWFDRESQLGMEFRWFLLEQNSVGFAQNSNAAGSPVINRAFQDFLTGGERGFLDAFPTTLAGGSAISSSSQMWGLEPNFVLGLRQGERLRSRLLAGVRYLSLRETLDINDTSIPLFSTLTEGVFGPVPIGTLETVNDRFVARNQFIGGQIGLGSEFRFSRMYVDVAGRLGLGSVHQTVDIAGNFAVTPPGGTRARLPGGLLAVPSNSGHFTRDQFGFLPEVNAKLGFFLTEGLRLFAGIDYLYLNHVARPGDQIDRVVDVRQLPAYTAVPQPGARPTFTFRDSDFWALGFNIGLEVRY